jgi:hypothetical protein
MNKIVSAALILTTLFMASCEKNRIHGEGAIISETRTPGSFTEIDAEGSTDIEIIPSSVNRVEISGYQNLLPIYETDVEGGTLHLRFDHHHYNIRHNNLKVKVYTNDISRIEMNGSGKMVVRDSLHAQELSLKVNGSGSIHMGYMTLQTLRSRVSGSGTINSKAAISEKAYAEVSGSGDIDLTVTQYLHARVSGSGTIDYWGSPSEVDAQVSGSGKIRKN